MRIVIALIIFLMIFVLSSNTALAADDYNSCRSNTSTSISITEQTGLDETVVAEILKEFRPSEFTTSAGDTIATIIIEEDKLREKLISLGIDEGKTQSVLDELRRGATREFLSKLPNPGLTPASPFYFLERWGEGIREFFTFSAEAKMKFHAERALERIAEVKAMLEEKEVNPRGLEIALERLEKNVQKASEGAKRFFDGYEEKKGKDVSRLALELGADFEISRMALNVIIEEADERRAATGNVKDKFPPSNDREKINKTFDEADEKLEAVRKVEDVIKEQPEPPSKRQEEAVKPTKPTPSPVSPIQSAPIQEKAPSAAGSAGEGTRAATDYNSSISNSHTVGKIREEIGNVLIRYGAGGAEINRVTDVLEVGVDGADLIALLKEINISEAGIQEVLAELERLGAKQR